MKMQGMLQQKKTVRWLNSMMRHISTELKSTRPLIQQILGNDFLSNDDDEIASHCLGGKLLWWNHAKHCWLDCHSEICASWLNKSQAFGRGRESATNTKHLSNFHTLLRKQIADGMGSMFTMNHKQECIYGIHRKLFHSDSKMIVSESRFVTCAMFLWNKSETASKDCTQASVDAHIRALLA